MIDPKHFDDLAERLNKAVPEGVRNLQQDVDRNLRAGVQAVLNRLDLVTREEFDIQAKVLARTRAQLDALAARVAALEQQVLGTTQPAVQNPPPSRETLDDQDMNGG